MPTRIAGLIFLVLLPASPLAAREFGDRKPEPGFARTHEFDWQSRRALGRRPEDLVGAMLHIRRRGQRDWEKSIAVFDPVTLYYSGALVKEDGYYELFEQLPALTEAAPKATDSAQTGIQVDSVKPAIRILNPTEGAVVQAGVDPVITYQVTDGFLNRKRAIDIFGQGKAGFVKLGTSVPYDEKVELKIAGKRGEKYTVYIVAVDRAGNVAGASVSFEFGSIESRPGAAPPVADRPVMSISFPEGSGGAPKIYHRRTDFAYRVSNETKSPLAAIEIMFSLDGGHTWQFGGKNDSGELSGFVTFRLPYALRRNQRAGAYERVRLAFIAVTENGATSRALPEPGDSGDLTVAVDVKPPTLFLESPFRDEVFTRGGVAYLEAENKFVVGWNAHDRNLEPLLNRPGFSRGPVAVWYSTQPESEPFSRSWRLIAKDLPAVDSFSSELDLPDAERVVILVTAEDELGNVSMARSGVFEITSNRPVFPDLRKNLAARQADRHWSNAILKQRSGRLREALAEYKNALVYAPARAAIIHDRGTCLYALGRVSDAAKAFEKAVELDGAAVGFRFSLAVLYYKRRETAEAAAQLKRIIELDAIEPHIGARMLLAAIYRKAGRKQDAVPLWRTVIANAPPGCAEYRSAKKQLAWAVSQ